MIKTFEQFVADNYGNPVNEAYQSSKLREIIKQHGKPKNFWELRLLYDLKDDEIIDVVDNRKEYWEKYSNEPQSPMEKEQATFMLELEDGACVVISNLDIFKSYFDEFGKKAREEKEELFKKRHSERHVGNLGYRGELDIRKIHRENVDKLMTKRFLEKLQPHIDEIINKVSSIMDNIDIYDFSEKKDTATVESEISLDGSEYTIDVNYTYSLSGYRKKYGIEYYNAYYNLDAFVIGDEDGNTVSNDDLNITFKSHKDLFKEYAVKDIEGAIYDYYEAYGISRSDFYSGM